MTLDEAHEVLFEDALYVTYNINDVFYWGVGDAVNIDVDDLPTLMPFIQQHGHLAIWAYAAIANDYDSNLDWTHLRRHRGFDREVFLLLITKMYELMEDGKILVSTWLRKRDDRIDREMFGHPVRIHSGLCRHRYKRFTKMSVNPVVAQIPGLIAVGDSVSTARERLWQKVRRRPPKQFKLSFESPAAGVVTTDPGIIPATVSATPAGDPLSSASTSRD